MPNIEQSAALANFNASDVAALTPEQRATFADSLAKAGFDRSAIDARLNAAVPHTTSSDGSTPGFSTGAPGTPNNPDNALSPNERLAAIETLKRAGVSNEAIEQALSGKTAEAPEFSTQRYHLNFGTRAGLVGTDELVALNNEIQNGFATAGIPSVYAQGLVDAMLGTADLYSERMTEAEVAFTRQSEMVFLTKLPNYDEVIRTAAVAFNALPADFRGMMNELHAFDSAAAYLALSRAGQRMEYEGNKK